MEIASKIEQAYSWNDMASFSQSTLRWFVNRTWSMGLAGKDVKALTEHAREFVANHLDLDFHLEADLAVTNNNGFGNIGLFELPQFVAAPLAERLGLDAYFSSQWQTDKTTPQEGTLTGEIELSLNGENKKRIVEAHQADLSRKYDFYRRTIGIGSTPNDIDFQQVTDFPVVYYGYQEARDFAHKQGYFTDKHGRPIYVEGQPLPRWQELDDQETMVALLNVIGNGRFPIKYNETRRAKEIAGTSPLWQSVDNELNEAILIDSVKALLQKKADSLHRQ
jgi:hypothetical protein